VWCQVHRDELRELRIRLVGSPDRVAQSGSGRNQQQDSDIHISLRIRVLR